MTDRTHIPLLMVKEQMEYQNLESGPEGPGLYRIEVRMARLSTDEILERLREKLSKPAETLQETRVVGCVEVGPHPPHRILVKNSEAQEWSWSPKFPHYLESTCDGSHS